MDVKYKSFLVCIGLECGFNRMVEYIRVVKYGTEIMELKKDYDMENRKDIVDKKELLLNYAEHNYKFIYEYCKYVKSQDKQLYKSVSSDVEKHMKSMKYIRPKNIKFQYGFLLGLYCVLDTDLGSIFIHNESRDYKDLEKWLKDKKFKIFYKKVLILLEFIENGKYKLADKYLIDSTMFLSNEIDILFLYFLCNETNITNEKIKSFLSKAVNWDQSILNFEKPLNAEQNAVLEEIKTGIKTVKLKQTPTKLHSTKRNKNSKYNVIEDMKNNIKIKYISKKNGKHSYHKSPTMHTRGGHWRHYTNGKKVWIQTMIVGDMNAA